MTDWESRLGTLAQEGMLRGFSPLTQRQDGTVSRDGRTFVNLSSNDYLGLAGNRELHGLFFSRLQTGMSLDSYGLGVASSRLLTGDTPVAHALEDVLAEQYGSEAALIFNSGYHANIGTLPALFGKGDLILSDKLNHASIHDGLRLCRADYKRYGHADYDQLGSLLKKYRSSYDKAVLVSESVFSMDGDCADLAALVELKERYDCLIYLDEAHAVGLYGKTGLGMAEQAGVTDRVDLLVGTFGKAFGSVGAYLICSRMIKDYLVNTSRSLIFTTGLPPIVLSWNLFVLQRLSDMGDKRRHLITLAARMRRALQSEGLAAGGSTQIVPVPVGNAADAVAGAAELQKLGYLILPVRPPTVPAGTSRFRLSLTADLRWEQLAELPQQLRSCLTRRS